MSFFQEHINVRLLSKDRKTVKNIVRFNKDLFENEGHFYRAAIRYFIKTCETRGLKTMRSVNKK